MPGGLLNIVAYGNQNIILNGNPSKTFFKTTYMKHTNFGVQKFRLDAEGNTNIDPNFDSTFKFKIDRRAELLLDSYLVVTLPDIYSITLPPLEQNDMWKPYHFRWIKNIGTSMIKNVRVMIGPNIIQEYPGSYLHCVVQRDYSSAKKEQFDYMTGNTDIPFS